MRSYTKQKGGQGVGSKTPGQQPKDRSGLGCCFRITSLVVVSVFSFQNINLHTVSILNFLHRNARNRVEGGALGFSSRSSSVRGFNLGVAILYSPAESQSFRVPKSCSWKEAVFKNEKPNPNIEIGRNMAVPRIIPIVPLFFFFLKKSCLTSSYIYEFSVMTDPPSVFLYGSSFSAPAP